MQNLVPFEVTSNRHCSSTFMNNQKDPMEDQEDQVKHQTFTRTRTRTIPAPQRYGFASLTLILLIYSPYIY